MIGQAHGRKEAEFEQSYPVSLHAQTSDGKTDGIDDLGRSEAIMQCRTAPCDEVHVITRVDKRVGVNQLQSNTAAAGVSKPTPLRLKLAMLDRW